MESNDELHASVLVMVINRNMDIVAMNKTAQTVFGAQLPRSAADSFSRRTLLDLSEIIQCTNSEVVSLYRTLIFNPSMTERRISVVGLLENIIFGAETCLRITALFGGVAQPGIEELIYSEEIHRAFAQSSSEAMWCIDFSEPVDLTRGTNEIIHQVFNNECRWLMCNSAMARVYNLPEGMDFNRQPVSLYFPRSPENEMFVRQIIDSDFHVEKALSIDTSHDGSMMYIENTVHCKIQDNFLLRMWGTVHDVTKYRQVRNQLTREISDVRSVLNALPDAILVIDRKSRLLAVNSSFQELFGWSPDTLFGRDIQGIINLNIPLPNNRKWYGVDSQKWMTTVRTSSGTTINCNIKSVPIGDHASDRFVITLQPITG